MKVFVFNLWEQISAGGLNFFRPVYMIAVALKEPQEGFIVANLCKRDTKQM